MCRLLAFSAKNQTTIPDFIGKDFSQFVALSNIHHDSWGVVLENEKNLTLLKAAETAATSSTFDSTICHTSGTGGLLHFRWASPGLPVKQENAHPFTYQDISFIHNGALAPYDALLGEIDETLLESRQGETDSELFFLFVLTKIQQSDFVTGTLKAITAIRNSFKYSSVNSIIMNSDFLIVVSEHDPNNKPDWADDIYYELRYRIDESGVVVASSGWDQTGWNLLENHQALVVNRHSLTFEIINL